MNQIKPYQTSMTEYIKCVRCNMKFINDDSHIQIDFGYNRLNERYKQCVKCRCNKAEYRAKMKDEIARTGRCIPKVKQAQDPSEIVECDVCCKTLRRDWMKKHIMSLNCKAYVNVKLYFKFNLFDLDIENISKLKHTMLYGDFDGAFYKFSDEDRKQQIRMDKSIDTFINGQLEIKDNMINKWGGLCSKLLNK